MNTTDQPYQTNYSLTEAFSSSTYMVEMNNTNWNTTEAVLEEAGIVEKVFKGVAMTVVILATILGNLLVICAVFKIRTLRTRNNYFIVSLAVADLLVGLLVQPFNMYNEMVQGEWSFGHVMCNFYNSNDVFFSTASLLHLCCISCDRYMAILHPFIYKRVITKRRVFLMIAGSWVLSALLSYVPIFAGWYATRQHLKERHGDPTLCTFEVSRTYAFISSSISFWIPCLVMVILYQRILTTALRQEREIRKLIVPAMLDEEELEDQNDEQTRELIERDNSSNNGGLSNSSGRPSVELSSWEGGEKSADRPESIGNGHAAAEKRRVGKEKGTSKKTDMREVKKLRKEHRAVKTLGIVMGSFILCMGPIFLWYTITFGICPDTCQLTGSNVWAITLVFWIGYFNSCMNPFIYAFFNRDFQQAFKKLLRSVRLGKTVRRGEPVRRGEVVRRSSTSSEIPPTPLICRSKPTDAVRPRTNADQRTQV